MTPTQTGKLPLQLGISARVVGEKGVIAQSSLPEQVVGVRVGVNYGRTFKRVAGWAIIAFIGGAIGKYGADLLELIEALS